MRRVVALLLVAGALLALWWWRRRAPDAHDTTAAGSAAHATAVHRLERAPDPAGRRIAGTVLLDGKPAAASVRLVGLAGQQRTTTDGSGHFAFEHVPVEKYTVIAEKPDTEGAARVVDLRDPKSVEEVILVMHACNFVVEGVVHDASSPISHASVAESDDGDTPGPAVESGDDGHYRLCVAPGDAELLVRADGYAQAVLRLSVSGHLRRDVELAPEAVIAGRVVRASDHAPIAGAVVHARLEDWQQAIQGWHAVSDSDGAFRITGASPGRILLTAIADHYAIVAPLPVIAEVAAPADTVAIEMQPAASVRGVVREAGKPVQGAVVSLDSKQGYREAASPDPFTEPDGTFELPGVVPGDYRLSVRTYKLAHEVSVTVAHDDVEGIVLDVERGPTIEGRVTYQGTPVDGATVQTRGGYATTDAAGHFTLVGLQPGKLRVYAESKRVGAFTPGPEITLAPDEHKTGLEIELDRSGSVAGTVIDQDGAPVGGALVKMSLLRGADFGEASTADDGTFTVRALAGGGNYSYEVLANDGTMKAYPPAEYKRGAVIAVRDGSTHVTGVKLRIRVDHLAISGHVTSAAGDPLADITVDATEAAQVFMLVRQSTAITDASGAFTLRNLQSGTYTVTARSPHGNQSVQAKAGRADVTIAIPDAATIEAVVEGFRETPDLYLVSLAGEGLFRPSPSGGHFVFRDVAPGKYRVRAKGRDGDAQAELTLAPGAHESVTLRRVARGSIAGTLVSTDGAPVANAECMSDSWQSRTVTDSTGAFRIEGVPAGSGFVICSNDHVGATARTSVPADGVATVKLVAVDPENRPKHPAGITIEEQLGDQVVTAVVAGGLADNAGLRVGDVLLRFDGISVTRLGVAVSEFFDDVAPGTTLTVTYQRGDQTLTAKLVSP